MTTCATYYDGYGAPLRIVFDSAPTPLDLSTCQYIYMTGVDYANIRAQYIAEGSLSIAPVSLPYDYQSGAAFWAYGFSSLLILYVVSHIIGLVVKAVRDY